MIAWVYERARKSDLLDRLTVATDSDAILTYCAEHGIPVVKTSAHHTSGTNRLTEVMDQERLQGHAADILVNIQGDEPMLTAAHIELLLKPFLEATSPSEPNPPLGEPGGRDDRQDRSPVQVSTLKVAISSDAARNPNAVKVVTDLRNRALYFSRSPIPCDRDATGRARFYKHLGFYAYTAEALRRFQSLSPSPLEQSEQLEQLRFLENGIPISVLETLEDTIGVDTEEDLRRVEDYLTRAGAR